MLVIIMTLSIA